MRYPFIAGNWKMYKTIAEARAFAEEFKKIYQPSDVRVAVCAPYPQLPFLVEAFRGTGIGVGITANKIPGIRAATVVTAYEAKYTRLHNDANVLCMGGRVIAPETAVELVELFISTQFEGGRHARRVAMIDSMLK